MRNSWILLETKDPLRFQAARWTDGNDLHWFEIQLPLGTPKDQWAVELASSLEDLGCHSEPVAFGLASQNVYAASVHLERGNRSSLPFELEEYSPLAAEEITCASTARLGNTLGCWVSTETYRTFFEELERRGILIRTVSASSLWAAQGLWQRFKPVEILLVESEEHCHLFHFESEQLAGWIRLNRDPGSVARHLKMFHEDMEVQHVKDSVVKGNGVAPAMGLETPHTLNADLRDESAKFAARILDDRTEAWIELCRGQLASTIARKGRSTSSQAVLVGVGAILLSLVIFALVVGARYNQASDHLRQEQVKIFQDLFPGESIPVGIRRRLQIRADQLQATRESPVELPERGVVLGSLIRLLQSMPQYSEAGDMRYHIDAIRISRNDLTLSGSVRDHGSAGQLAQLLTQHGFEVSPPKTENLASRGVSVNLTAIPSVSDPGISP